MTLPTTFDPIAYTGEVEKAARGGLDGALPFADGERSSAAVPPRRDRWRQRTAAALSLRRHPRRRNFRPAVFAGNDPAARFFAAFDVTMFPILNPAGLARGVRTNRDGIDLNRDYQNSRSLEIKGHIETLLTLGRFDASMMLHEDYEGIGAYLCELNDTLDSGLGAKIIAAMGLHVPIDLRPAIEEWAARDGVISGRDFIAKLGPLEDLPEWAEAIYLSVHHTDAVYTIETPKPFPIKARVKAHIAAVETLVNALKG